jgi:hypothetical protein
VFVQSAFANETATLENSRGSLMLHMAKRIKPSDTQRRRDVNHGGQCF